MPKRTDIKRVLVIGSGFLTHGLPFLKDFRPDAVVLDMMLPDFDGLEVLRRMRGDDPNVPVLFLTAKDAVEDRVAGLEPFDATVARRIDQHATTDDAGVIGGDRAPFGAARSQFTLEGTHIQGNEHENSDGHVSTMEAS